MDEVQNSLVEKNVKYARYKIEVVSCRLVVFTTKSRLALAFYKQRSALCFPRAFWRAQCVCLHLFGLHADTARVAVFESEQNDTLTLSANELNAVLRY